MAKVLLYTTSWCPFCHHAKKLLDSKGVAYQDINVDADPALREEMTARSGGRTVPQIFINDEPVGGCDDLYALERSGSLDGLLAADEQAAI